MARVELHIHPPLSYKMSSKIVGPLILEERIDQNVAINEVNEVLSDG